MPHFGPTSFLTQMQQCLRVKTHRLDIQTLVYSVEHLHRCTDSSLSAKGFEVGDGIHS
jgi:hypothetical protein